MVGFPMLCPRLPTIAAWEGRATMTLCASGGLPCDVGSPLFTYNNHIEAKSLVHTSRLGEPHPTREPKRTTIKNSSNVNID